MQKLLIISTGAETHASIYDALVKLPVETDICYDETQPQSRCQRVEQQSENFNLPLHRLLDLPELLTDTPPDRVLLLVEFDKVNDFVLTLMPLLDTYCPPKARQAPVKIMVSNPPVNVLEDMLELLAFSEVYGIEVWLNAPRRYASGVQYLYRCQSIAPPLTQIRSTIDTGLYNTGGIVELMQHAWQHTDLIYSLLAAAVPENESDSDFSILPAGLSAEYSDFYRDALSVSFTCDDIIVSLSASTNDTGNLGFRETLQVSCIGGATIELNASLNEYRYVNGLDTSDSLARDVGMDIDVNADEFMAAITRDLLGTEPTNADAQDSTPLQQMLLDFLETEPSRHAPTLKSCLPGIWTVDGIQRSLDSGKRIQRPEARPKIPRDQMVTADVPEDRVAEAFQVARDGALEAAVDRLVRPIQVLHSGAPSVIAREIAFNALLLPQILNRYNAEQTETLEHHWRPLPLSLDGGSAAAAGDMSLGVGSSAVVSNVLTAVAGIGAAVAGNVLTAVAGKAVEWIQNKIDEHPPEVVLTEVEHALLLERAQEALRKAVTEPALRNTGAIFSDFYRIFCR